MVIFLFILISHLTPQFKRWFFRDQIGVKGKLKAVLKAKQSVFHSQQFYAH